ncbi:hypothetical protein HOY82DRAFT_95882 [Tuber indicum]|nr:hypothetical protein HOY82DRAFT_95882 [Tuber indicum]
MMSTPLRWIARSKHHYPGLSNRHNQVVKMLLEPDLANPDTADPASFPSLPTSAGCGDECTMGLQFRSGTLNTDTANISGQLSLLSSDPNECHPILDHKSSLSKSTDSDLPTTEQPVLYQPPPTWPLSFWYPRRKSGTHPDQTRSILSLTVDWYFIIASFVCLFASLFFILRPSLPEIFLLRK